ncbi:MAG: DUF1570 domain-containing protein, partial [Planctomycetota bacterium]
MHRKTIFRSVSIIATAVATCSPAQVPPEKTESARLLALGGERFSIRRTDHFLIASDGDEGAVNPLADRLEAAYQAVVRFAEDMKLPIHPPSDPLPVLLFNRHSDFERYAGSVGFKDPAAPGFYHPRNNTAAFCNVLDLPQLRDISQRIEQAEAPERIIDWRSQRDAIVKTFNRLVIQHEAAHQVLFNTGVLSRDADNPDWLVEGLACQFEVSSRDAVNQMRLADFREALAAAPTADAAAASALSATTTQKNRKRHAPKGGPRNRKESGRREKRMARPIIAKYTNAPVGR